MERLGRILNGHFLFKLTVLWGLFFVIALSLGYPTLNRYDPGKANLSDNIHYHNLITEGFQAAAENHWRYRVLVPYVAKSFYHLGKGRIGSWNPVAFGLLVANAIFLASTALILLMFCFRISGDMRAGFIAGLLLLANFNVSNLYLAGLIDSGEVFLATILAWSLLNGFWVALPVIGILGGLTKETCIPIGVALASGWFLSDWLKEQFNRKHFLLIVAFGLTSLMTLAALKVAGGATISWPWENLAGGSMVKGGFFSEFFGLLINRNFYYTFIWLLPLGALGLRYIPRGWVWGSAVSTIVVLILSAGIGVGDNIGRPLFSAAGPMLIAAAAIFLWSYLGGRKVGGDD